jgi:Sulfotransferase family
MRTVIAHGHIFKNAGTTFDWSLKRNFGTDFCDHRDDDLMLRHGASYLGQYLRENPGIRAISSHHLCDTSAIEGIEVIPVYLLRHPVERILSVYSFERKQESSSPGATAAKKYNFKDYVKWRMEPNVNAVIRNYQTVYLAGQQGVSPVQQCTASVYNIAMSKLQASLVGIVEQFDASMVRFEEAFKKRHVAIDLSYVKQNVGSEDTALNTDVVSFIAEALGDLLKEVLSNNAYDLALYCAATQQLEQEEVSAYPDKLAEFKTRCARLLQYNA